MVRALKADLAQSGTSAYAVTGDLADDGEEAEKERS
jgi:hypothetical protein